MFLTMGLGGRLRQSVAVGREALGQAGPGHGSLVHTTHVNTCTHTCSGCLRVHHRR